MTGTALGWFGIFRLGLVQAALGSIVVLTTSTLNRVMVVELALPAMLPGALVALHYFVQISRPRMGYGSDLGGRRMPWIIGGIAVLGSGAILAALATVWMETSTAAGIALAVLAFCLIGAGVGAAGTTLLVFLSKRVTPHRRAAAATITWLMMIAGFAVTAGIAGHFLDPFSPQRLVVVTATVAAIALALTLVAVWRLETVESAWSAAPPQTGESGAAVPFRQALAQVWQEPHTRRFSLFVFISMLAYSAQDLILEPFAGTVFGLTPGQSTQLSGLQHAGVLAGMLLVALVATRMGRGRTRFLRNWAIGGCIASALILFGLALAGYVGPDWPLRPTVGLLGLANGVFAVAAIGAMMALVGNGTERREGVRMGLWGAAQAVAFGLGGFTGTLLVDLTRYLLGAALPAYALVFALEGGLFLVAAFLALRIHAHAPSVRAGRFSESDIVNAGGRVGLQTGMR